MKNISRDWAAYRVLRYNVELVRHDFNASAPREVKMSEKLVSDLIEAAGGIVEHGTSREPLVAVVYRERYGGEWGLPKGKRKAGRIVARDGAS